MSSLFDSKLIPSDKEFQYLLEHQGHEDEIRFLDELWEKYKPYADRQFRKEIGRNFHQRYWEMYLACSLMEYGLELIPKSSEKGPDLCVRVNNSHVWIEAIAPSGGEGPDAIMKPPKLEVGQVDWFRPPEEKIILRYLSAISEKYTKYKGYLQEGYIEGGEPYIIAVNGRRVPYSTPDDDPPYIVKAVFPLGRYQLPLDSDTGRMVSEGYSYRSEITKANKALVSTRIFLDKAYSGVSGILFPNSDLLNRPRQLGSELIFIHNPMADNPLPQGWLRTGWEYLCKDNQLWSRHWNK